MKQILLTPIKELPNDWDALEEYIARVFKREIYIPLLSEIDEPVTRLENSRNDLIDAIKRGQVTYYRGVFSGKFNSRISRGLREIGASFHRGDFQLTIDRMPMDVKTAIDLAEMKFKKKLASIDRRLEELNPEELASRFKIEEMFETTIHKVDRKFQDSVRGITVAPQLTKEGKERIAREYTQNMQLYIQEWAKKEIVELRHRVSERAAQGLRHEGLVKEIQGSYGVARSKAKFLARQETALLMAKYRQIRYEEAGSESYKWTCVVGSPNHPVRPMHKRLDGKIIRWDSPPVVDSEGNRKHAGCDYNCRCYPIAIIKF